MKSIDFLGITEESAKAIISNRELQSIDFETSASLISILNGRGESQDAGVIGLRLITYKNGQILLSPGEAYNSEKNTITIDFETLSFSDVSPAMILTAIQKLLRFAIKFWNNLNLNNNEYLPPGSTKAIVFPFPITAGTSYRLTVERSAGERRLSRRFLGKHLLTYKFGTSEGSGTKEEFSTTNFNKSIEAIFDRALYKTEPESSPQTSLVFNATTLEGEQLSTSLLLGVDDPYKKLSSKQLEFINKPFSLPSRIEGPAGSGKTICLVLKCLHWLREAHSSGTTAKFLFIVPSQEMAQNVHYFFEVLDRDQCFNNGNDYQRVEIKTLQDVCSDFLKNDIHESELLDEDTFESKNIQLLHLVEVLQENISDLAGHKDFISKELYSFLEKDDTFKVAELIRHEISVVIKGRCDETFDNYRLVSRPAYGLPLQTEEDRRFIFNIFNKYSEILNQLSQFDVDDIAISAISKLDSPIWRRRRSQEGYDSIFIDEVHLFNMNELSLVHFLTKNSMTTPIAYAIDLSQALGDIAWNDAEFHESLGINSSEEKTTLSAVFRCSPTITDLAFSITSHGANIFTNFDNPISQTPYIYGDPSEEEIPQYFMLNNQKNLLEQTFKAAEKLRTTKGLKRHQIAIIFFDRIIFSEALKYAADNKKPISQIVKRGDIEAIKIAEKSSANLVAVSDYIGGLEFEAVILAGVDKGRVPNTANITSTASKMYQNYISHNRLYVSVTRARNTVWIIGEEIRGSSEVLESAIHNKKIAIQENYSF
ncbi:UvrD-helicase domain-containing protein [Pseudomonas juntendi]|uniref:UvrD-helicase domain-containing protein n=1 Tax=Pseudomonas juntendi TaxID=2666183 RepID=UPI0024488316|nr:UvrD-helicase domain-containing protein [Pseudomonas juntendi]MDG9890431.1 ATP-binding domain-containing protein [Pseudomonas juntendi]MDH0047387.1 ATP-binding domain-containing protein [Pseudomonas juntendi]